MKLQLISFFSLTVVFSLSNAKAEKVGIVMSGECNDKNVTSSLGVIGKDFSNTLSSSGWKVTPVSSKKELLKALEKIATDSSKNQSDELLLDFLVHGSPETPRHAHALSMPDCSLLQLDDPDLTRVLEKIKKKNVKMGFLDGSCYAGGSVDAFKKYGCVMASQVKTVETYSDLGNLPSGKIIYYKGGVTPIKQALQTDSKVSMEDIYLSTLINDSYNSQQSNFAVLSDDANGTSNAEKAAFISHYHDDESVEQVILDMLGYVKDPKFKMKENEENAKFVKSFLKDFEKSDWFYFLRSNKGRERKLKKKTEKIKCSIPENAMKTLQSTLDSCESNLDTEKLDQYKALEPTIKKYLRVQIVWSTTEDDKVNPENALARGDLSYKNQLAVAIETLGKIKAESKDGPHDNTLKIKFANAINILRAYEYLDHKSKIPAETNCSKFTF